MPYYFFWWFYNFLGTYFLCMEYYYEYGIDFNEYAIIFQVQCNEHTLKTFQYQYSSIFNSRAKPFCSKNNVSTDWDTFEDF